MIFSIYLYILNFARENLHGNSFLESDYVENWNMFGFNKSGSEEKQRNKILLLRLFLLKFNKTFYHLDYVWIRGIYINVCMYMFNYI